MSYKLRKPRPGKSDYYQAIITAPDGRTFERSTKCARATEAHAVAARWDRDAALSRHQVSIEQAFTMLHQKMRDRGNAAATFEIFELKVAHMLGYFGRERAVDTIELKDTLGYVRHRRAKGVGDSTIGKELGYYRSALRYLVRHKLYAGDPRDIWPGDELGTAKPRTRWLTVAEYQALVLAMAAPRGYFRDQYSTGDRRWIEHDEPMGRDWREYLTTYVCTGMRFSELLRIEARHVDGDRLRIPGTKTRGAFRIIPLHPDALAVLERRVQEYPRGPLFPVTSPSQAAHKRSWLRALRRACERAGLAHASTNDLRRTFCSWAFQAGVSEALCVRWMGHASARMVREVYAQASPEQERDAIANLPRISQNHGAKAATVSNPPQHKSPRNHAKAR